jgi:hypothetical protein
MSERSGDFPFPFGLVVKWVPPDKKPADTSVWYEALVEAGLEVEGRVVLTWEADGWRVSSAFNPYGTSPSGTVAKPEDVREKLTRLLQAKGLPVKT